MSLDVKTSIQYPFLTWTCQVYSYPTTYIKWRSTYNNGFFVFIYISTSTFTFLLIELYDAMEIFPFLWKFWWMRCSGISFFSKNLSYGQRGIFQEDCMRNEWKTYCIKVSETFFSCKKMKFSSMSKVMNLLKEANNNKYVLIPL